MSRATGEFRAPFRIVLGDANVLYSRVLRDYLLYAATRQIIRVRWSAAILDEVVEHLTANVGGFDADSGARLVAAMNGTFPNAEVAPTDATFEQCAKFVLPDEDDRHVLAAAVAAEADILCTDNIKHFPPEVMAEVGIEVLTADDLLALLTVEFSEEMLAVHRLTVSRLAGANRRVDHRRPPPRAGEQDCRPDGRSPRPRLTPPRQAA